jgi:hypothetical protein
LFENKEYNSLKAILSPCEICFINSVSMFTGSFYNDAQH